MSVHGPALKTQTNKRDIRSKLAREKKRQKRRTADSTEFGLVRQNRERDVCKRAAEKSQKHQASFTGWREGSRSERRRVRTVAFSITM